MQSIEALQYLAQLANDYVRTLPPSAAQPVHQVAQECVNTLLPLVQLPPEAEAIKTPAALRAVSTPPPAT